MLPARQETGWVITVTPLAPTRKDHRVEPNRFDFETDL
jgi:hypothetical protein